ncbi:hypothetical protein BFP97_17415 [Roseivirga sp. 4D4]|nr:hypothetical protein BFP97_17415 [Roseivirga sp. 4D4]
MDIYLYDNNLMAFQTLTFLHIALMFFAFYKLYNDTSSGTQRIFSFLLLLFVPIIGSLIYLKVASKSRRNRKFNLDR